MDDFIKINYIEVNQPIGKFYIASIKCKELLDIARFDVRRIIKEEKSDIDTYFGIQRKPSSSRLAEISEYVSFIDATFPSSVVVAIKSKDFIEGKEDIVNVKINEGQLFIRRNENVAQIIDGQHRLLGLQKAIDENSTFSSKADDFELVVTIYLDMDIENQSMVFATINKAQTKVNKSLVFDLYDLANSRSPYRTAHNIVRVLNENDKSPLKNKIKMLGVADDVKNETIAQATLVDCIVEYISKTPLRDRDTLKRGEEIYVTEKDKKLFFRKWFKEKQDILITKTIINYFSAISKKWNESWKSNSILVKSTGVIAFMKFLSNVLSTKDMINVVSEEEFAIILKDIDLLDTSFTNDNYPSGGIGQSKLKNDLIEKSGLNKNA